ncbi:MAG: hypothetical protein ABH818_00970 [Patescibacteria group bacterium]|nr:hypothetical protein [Patescibacteria group bacterium]MBU1870884.1 hypothetical protein [Patescibacteria group bacterium]
MQNLLRKINKKINGLIFTFITSGIVLLMLGILVICTNFVLRLIVGLLILVISYSLFYGGFKIWSIRKEIIKYLKLS